MSDECQYCDSYSRAIQKLEQENAKLKERLKDAESVILTFKKYTDDLIYLTDVEMEIIILNYLEKWGE